jgi:hypothetical protein
VLAGLNDHELASGDERHPEQLQPVVEVRQCTGQRQEWCEDEYDQDRRGYHGFPARIHAMALEERDEQQYERYKEKGQRCDRAL